MADIANFIAQNFRGPNLAAVDNARYTNALARNRVERLPQQNKADDLALRQQEQSLNAGQVENAMGVLDRQLAMIEASPRARETAIQITSTPDWQSLTSFLKLPPIQIDDTDTDDSLRANAQQLRQALRGVSQQQRLVGVANPSDFTPESLAKYQQSGNPGDLVQVEQNLFGRYNPRDYTPESLARFQQTGNPGDLMRVAPLQARDNPAGGTDVFDPVSGSFRQPVRTPEQGTQQAANRAQAVARAEATGGAQGGIKGVRSEAAVRRLERVKSASEALSVGGPVVGGAAGLTPKGQELNQANAQLITELTALTRIPGVGAQSDLEQRLAQLQLPTPEMYPSVRANAIAELEMFVRDLDAALNNTGAPSGNLDFSQMTDEQLMQIINGQ